MHPNRIASMVGSSAAAVAASLVLPAAATAVVPEYSLLDLGTPGGTRSEAFALNNAGQVAGWGRAADGSARAFRTAPNAPINPSTDLISLLPGGTANFAYAINVNGDVAGGGNTLTGDRAFLYTTADTLTTLPTLGGTWNYANAINARGDVVGGAALAKPPGSPPTHAALYSGSSAYDLQTLAGQDSYAYAINTAGTVAGYRQLPSMNGITYEHAFIWIPTTTNGTAGTMTDLGSLGGNYSYAWGINDASVIVGSSTTLNDAASHAFRWTPSALGSATGTMTDLGTFGGYGSEAYAVNAAGRVVGYADTPSSSHAFVHIGGTMYDLNDHLTPAAAGWVLTSARAINNADQIAGTGSTPTGEAHAFLLTPKPTWNLDADGPWSAAGNWIGVLPSGTGAEAQFTSAITAPRTVTLDSPRTLGKLVLNSTVPYTLTGSPLTLSALGGTPSVEVRAGGHTLAAPLDLGTRAALNLSAGAALKLSGPVSGTLSSLTLAPGATLDLADNDLILDYDGSGGSPLTSIRGAIASGYNGGAWTGTGITSSSAAVQPASATAIACVEASDAGLASFNGTPLDGTAVLLKYTWYGDANLDGKVNADDFALIDRGFAKGLTGWLNGDFNYDGTISSADYLLIDRVYAQQTGVLSPDLLNEREARFGPGYVAALVAAVPEPAGVAIAALAVAVAAYRPRRRRQRPKSKGD